MARAASTPASSIERKFAMSRFPAYACALAIGLLSGSFAPCCGGPRFFPATLGSDEPCVAAELSLPTVSWSKTGDVPPASEWDLSAEISKRITEDLGLSIGDVWSQIIPPGG